MGWFMAGKRQAIMRLMDAMLEATEGRGVDSVREWCRVNGVNERTFYRHRARVAAEGRWSERSRRPGSSPTATPEPVVAEVLGLRESLAPDHGADSIHSALLELADAQDWAGQGLTVPARATINRILDRAGLLDKNPAKRPRASYRRFSYARPRDCFQIDATEHALADGSAVVAFDVLDDCSRVWVASYVAPAETIAAAIEAMTLAVGAWGAPGLVLADNGTAFAHPRRGRDKTLSSAFSRALAQDWGTAVVHSSPYHPQTLGKNERLHQTSKKLLEHRWPDDSPTDSGELQARLDTVREHYNHHRRHSAIATGAVRTPAQAWHAAGEHGGPGDLPRQTDATVHRLTVVSNGTVTLADRYQPTGRANNHVISLGRARTGQQITLLRNGDHLSAFSADGDPIGHLHLDTSTRYQGSLTPAAPPQPTPTDPTTPPCAA